MRYAGYQIRSSVALPSLACAGEGSLARTILIAQDQPAVAAAPRTPCWRHHWSDESGGISLQVAALTRDSHTFGDRYLLRAPEQCDFIIDPSKGSILIEAPPALAGNTLEHLLLDQAIPRLLAGRGHLVLHASLIRLKRSTIAVLGRSGWGKSTLAALFHRRGYPSLCDDCALLEVDGNQVTATPSYPGLRLYADSIDQALATPPQYDTVTDYSDKQRIIGLDLDGSLLEPQPLAAICVLEDPAKAGRNLALQPLTAATACMAIIEHGFRLDPTDRASTMKQLRQASTTARLVPAFRLQHPRDFARKEELIAFLLNQFDTPATSPS